MNARTDLAAVVLAAGAGARLRPLTDLRPKALCPVNNVALVDLALHRARRLSHAVAVNVHHGRDQLEEHLAGRVHVSVESPRALETAGALGQLRSWLDGRDALCLNVDVWHPDDLQRFVTDWDRERVRLLTVRDLARGDFGELRYTGAALLPWAVVRDLPARRHGLYPAVIAPHHEAGRLDLCVSDAPYHDCGTPRGYLAANLAASGGASVVGAGAEIRGRVVRCVVWPGAEIRPGEILVEAIRADRGVTVRTLRHRGRPVA